jgi:hypothetical protein
MRRAPAGRVVDPTSAVGFDGKGAVGPVREGGCGDLVRALHPRTADQFTALVPPGTIPGEMRELIIKSPDLYGLMDQLGDVFPPTDLD